MKLPSMDEPYRVLLFGEPGVGKSVFAATATKPLFCMADPGGWESLLNHEWSREARVIIPESFRECESFAKACKLGKLPELYRRINPQFDGEIETAVFDSFGMMRDMDLLDQRGDRDDFHKAMWSKNNLRMNDLLRDAFKGPYNVILVAHVREDKDAEGTTVLTRPDLSAGLSTQVYRSLSGIFYLTKKGKDRLLRVNPTGSSFIAKNRYGALNDEIINPNFQQIEAAIAKWRTQPNTLIPGVVSSAESGD